MTQIFVETYQDRFVRLFFVLSLIMVTILGLPETVQGESKKTAAEKRGYMTYDEYHNIEARIANGSGYVFRRDENIYGYTKQYRKIYRGMPERWLESELTGALGVAWRYEEDDVFQCGYNGEAKNCKRVSHCKMELYLDESKMPGWIEAASYQANPFREKSVRFLVPQNESDRKARAALLKSAHGVLGKITYRYRDSNGTTMESTGYVSGYDRHYDVGIDKPTLDISCAVARQADTGSEIVIELFAGTTQEYKISLPGSYVSRIQDYLSQKPEEVEAFDEPIYSRGNLLSGSYTKWFTREGWESRNKEGYFLLDPNIWVYTRKFGNRFGMPEKWVSDDILPAEAFAFRTTRYYTFRCGYGGDPQACTQNVDKLLDVYIPDNRPIPWNPYYRNFELIIRSEPIMGVTGREGDTLYDHKISIPNQGDHIKATKIEIEYYIKSWFSKQKRRPSVRKKYYHRNAYPNLSFIGGDFYSLVKHKNVKNPRLVLHDIDSFYWGRDSKDRPTMSFKEQHDSYPITEAFMERMMNYVELHRDELDGLWNIVKSQLNLKD